MLILTFPFVILLKTGVLVESFNLLRLSKVPIMGLFPLQPLSLIDKMGSGKLFRPAPAFFYRCNFKSILN
tara:strand:+ start:4691 stop:4900 length:210 start_codon:yes stop_codon:yes gene_type:complete